MKRSMRAERKAFIRAERRSVKRQKKDLRRIKRSRRWHYLKDQYHQVIDSFSGFTGDGETRMLRNDLLVSYLNSVVLFVIAFWSVYLLGQFITLATAHYFSIPAVLHSYRTEWPLFTYSPSYTILNLILIFGSGPLVCLLVALLSFRIYRARMMHPTHLNLFLLWITFHGVNLFFGAYIAGVFTRTGLVFASAWIFRSMPFDPEEILFLVIAAIILLAAGTILMRHLVHTVLTLELQNPAHHRYVLAAQVVLPWLTGTILILLINTPHFPDEFMLVLGLSLLLLIPGFFQLNAPLRFEPDESLPASGIRLNRIALVIFIIFMILIRVLVYPGISIN